MNRKPGRIALFTSFHPDIGGGSVNLRTLLAEMKDLEVVWFYLGSPEVRWPGAVCVGHPLIGGPILQDMWRSPLLLSGLYTGPLRPIAARMHSDFDISWVVAMNEGIAVGNLLAASTPRHRLHVSVQDDQAGWMWSRSRRYKWFSALVRRSWRHLLRSADSVDVTSDGMRDYYRKTIGVDSSVVHPYVRDLSPLAPVTQDPRVITIGHIGSIYDKLVLARFLRVARRWAQLRGKNLRFLFIGLGAGNADALKELGTDQVESIPGLAEPAAVVKLHACDFLYAMYPFKSASKVFRQTSLPTKLSTYVQAQRPILAHTPTDSSLARLIAEQSLGVVAPTEDTDLLLGYIDQIMALPFSFQASQRARREVYGEANVEKLRSRLQAADGPQRSGTRKG